MKPPQFDPNSDNWAWPEKTWFQERLNAMRARRHEAHRKPATNQKEPVAVETKNSGDPSKNKSPAESQKTISQTLLPSSTELCPELVPTSQDAVAVVNK